MHISDKEAGNRDDLIEVKSMHRVKKKKYMILMCLIIAGGILASCFYSGRRWTVNDIYGQWKASRLIYRTQGSYGCVLTGNEIGRSFTISENQIIDSRSEEMCTLIGQYSLNMVCTSIEEKEYADHAAFREEGKVSLKAEGRSAGIPDGKIKEFTFFETTAGGYEFSVFTYDYRDKDKLVLELQGDYYLLERFKRTQKIDNPYGKWYVESMVSRGRGEQEGIQFFKEYGKCYELEENLLRIGAGERIQDINWHIKKTDRLSFERENGIVEGLGILDKEIYVWTCQKGEKQLLCMIPINKDEIIVQNNEQWFRLHRLDKYAEPAVNWENQLCGEWKFTQCLSCGEESAEDQEINEYYTKTIEMDAERYIKGAVTEWETEACTVSELNKKIGSSEYLEYFFHDDDIIHLARRKVYGTEQVFIVISPKRMIYSSNGVLFIIENVE